MIERLVRFALGQRVLVLVVSLGLLVWGAYSFFQLPVEAYPDVMNTQVQIVTQWPGHAAEEVEQLITVPLETNLNGVPKVKSLRSRSLFGLSDIRLTFEDDVDDYFAHQVCFERMSQATLPTGIQPVIQPISSATGEIYRYTVTGAPLIELKDIEDWVLEREFKSIPGVADVNSFGGIIKQYQVIVDPAKLRHYAVSLSAVTGALTSANANTGGSTIEMGSEAYVVRGVGLFKSVTDIGNVVVSETGGTAVRISDVGSVRIGFQNRLGKVGYAEGPKFNDHDDAVEGIVLMLRGENPGPVLERIHAKVQALNNGVLPPGVQIHPFIDRTDLVHTTTHTVEHNLLEGVLLVVAVLLMFLLNVRAAVIVAMTIPFGLLFAFSLMGLIHVPANLISLGAVDFGVIVNGSVILVENVYRRLSGRTDEASIVEAILAAAGEVQSEIFFTTVIIILAYLPLFAMESVEKKMFSPMAYTIGLALVGSLIMALMVAPVLCFLSFRKGVVHKEARFETWIRAVYERCIDWALAHRAFILVGAAATLVLGGTLFTRLGTEFLPHLDEGNLWIRATMPNTISYTEAAALMPKFRAMMRRYEPVTLVVSQLGRPDDGTDSTGFYNAEFLVNLKPYSDWRGYHSKDELIASMSKDLGQVPGISWNFSQNIEDNVEEAVTGVKGELAVKLYGNDLHVLTNQAARIQAEMAKVPGVTDLATFTELGEPQVVIDVDRDKVVRYGLQVQDVENVVNAIGGSVVTQVLDGERRFDVSVRFPHEARDNIDAICNLGVDTPDGQHIPLAQLARIRVERGASFIYREANKRFIAIKYSVRGRDLGGAVEAAQHRVAEAVKLPPGYFTEWGGEYESLQRANKRLMVITPLTLLLIFVVLYALFGRVSRALIVMMNVPLSLSGAIVSLYLTGFHLSVSAAVGFIALFGVAVQNGVIMVSYFDHLRQEQGVAFLDAIREGAKTRLRPVLMTALLASIGLLPAALSTGIGSDVQKPLAIAIIGGLMADVLTGTIFVLPVLYALVARPRPEPLTSLREA